MFTLTRACVWLGEERGVVELCFARSLSCCCCCCEAVLKTRCDKLQGLETELGFRRGFVLCLARGGASRDLLISNVPPRPEIIVRSFEPPYKLPF